MAKIVRTFNPQEKSQVALAAIKNDKTMAQISSDFKLHPTQIGLWKKQVTDNLVDLFKDNKKKEKQKELENQTTLDNLYKLIGQRDLELDWLKKKLQSG